MKYSFPVNYGTSCVLVPIDTALIPLVSGALAHFELRGYWLSDEDFEAGYNAFAELQAAMANNCLVELIAALERIQIEIRAMRGIDELDAGYNDPQVDPFTLRMGHIEKVAEQLEQLNPNVATIKTLLEGMQNAETLEDIKSSAAQIALLLA